MDADWDEVRLSSMHPRPPRRGGAYAERKRAVSALASADGLARKGNSHALHIAQTVLRTNFFAKPRCVVILWC